MRIINQEMTEMRDSALRLKVVYNSVLFILIKNCKSCESLIFIGLYYIFQKG